MRRRGVVVRCSGAPAAAVCRPPQRNNTAAAMAKRVVFHRSLYQVLHQTDFT